MARTKFNEITKEIEKSKIKIDNSYGLIDVYVNIKHLTFVEEIKPNKDLFMIIAPLTSQSKGPKQEERIIYMFGGKKIKSEADKGDYVDANGNFFEVKCSTPSKNLNVLNIVQIRPHQQIEYYICCFIDDVQYMNNYCFKLSKEQMNDELDMIGHSAHGAAIKVQLNKEYRISIDLNKLDNVNTKR
jgi:hypothetical protein